MLIPISIVFEKTGKALFLCPSEERFSDRVATRKVPIGEVGQKNSKKQSIRNQLQGLLFKDPEFKFLGQKAFVGCCRGISFQKNREVFKLEELPLDEYATNIELFGTPRIRGLKSIDGAKIKEIKNAPRGLQALEGASSDEGGEGEARSGEEVRAKYDRMVERGNFASLVQGGGAEPDHEGDFLTVKRSGYDSDVSDPDIPDPAKMRSKMLQVPGKEIVMDSKRKEKMLKSKKDLSPRAQDLFSKMAGEARQIYELQDEDKFREAGPAEIQRRKFLDEEGKRVREADIGDRKLAKEKWKEKRMIQELRAVEEGAVIEERSHEDEFRVELVSYGDAEGDQLGYDEDVEEERQPKRQKWVENDEEKEKTERKLRRLGGELLKLLRL
ncbi:unnamed protein product [Tuber aestivum]|uniref:ATP-dependent rRNA helicase SPB4-like C-terminal extension domain-containing protein n=1 Tax=Tuber aestivum TaxID=59557 RepID=A0A292Q8U8_9PEZI|nr:unnamed protein product [Tuber aestivum]